MNFCLQRFVYFAESKANKNRNMLCEQPRKVCYDGMQMIKLIEIMFRNMINIASLLLIFQKVFKLRMVLNWSVICFENSNRINKYSKHTQQYNDTS